MSEAEFTARVCKGLEALGAVVYVLPGVGLSSGLPDRLMVHRDWAGLLEFKGKNTKVQENQRITMSMCLRRGFPAFVVRDSPGPDGMVGVLQAYWMGVTIDPIGRFKDAAGLLELLRVKGSVERLNGRAYFK